ncbi:AlpA family phage regulatory protein [Agarivorans sp. B2Z047]|nr:AlpA family phage regulatory protein [Agarivorans sp. B2Z047]
MRFITLKEVLKKLSISRSALYLKIQTKQMPQPIKLGARRVAWLEHEIDEVIAILANGRSSDDIQRLVENQINTRKEMLIKMGLDQS